MTEYATKLLTEQFQPPALDFMYDLSPIIVSINDRPPSVLHFLVRLAAVVGGVFAVTRELWLGKAEVDECGMTRKWAQQPRRDQLL